MKNNNKNRKLKFIREKNNLRLGINSINIFYKISNKIDIITYANYLIDASKKEIFKKYKLKLRKNSFNFDKCDEDFIKDLITIKITLNN